MNYPFLSQNNLFSLWIRHVLKNICVVTATRSEYGLLRWIIDILSKDKDVNLQIVATGAAIRPKSLA